jgi:type I restriction enzyme S subunit
MFPVEAVLPEGFRMTALGPLPAEWEVVRLGELFEIQQGKALSPRTRAGARKRPFLRTANVLWGRVDLSILDEMHFDEGEEARLALVPGDLLVCEGGDIGRTAIWEGQLPLVLYQNHLHRLRPARAGVDPLFYMYWMQAAWLLLGLYGGAGNKTTIPNLSRSRLAGFPVPLPPLPEQRAIAHVLRTVQRAKEATERVIAALKELKKSLMRHLFTYGPVPVDQADQVPLKETELGPAPEHWEVVPIGQVGRVITGRTPPTSHSEYWNGSIPFITPVDLQGGPVRTTQRSITNEGLRKARPLPRGAVLVSCIGYIGKVGVVDSDVAVTNQQINAIVPQRVDSWFLAFALMHETALLESRARMTTVPILHKTNFQRVPIPLPPLDEQREIARMLQVVDARIAAEQARRAALEELFKTLLHLLMTAKLRVPYEGARHA